MGFTKNLGLQLYVEDVAKEKAFFQAIGFELISSSEMMDYEYVTMRTHPDSTVLFTIYAKSFIRQVSPEVVDMTPSILFEAEELAAVHDLVTQHTDTCSDISMNPFPNFHFGTPGGLHVAVKGVS